MSEITIGLNGVSLKSETRSVGVKKNKKGSNILHIKSLTANVGKESGVKSFLSEDDLIKNSIMSLSDEAILEVTLSLMMYVTEVLGAEIDL